ncbi:MAG: hypothetical protein FWE98_05715 [Oscillospiraceae bacterium]|nr:hypothetical protein [Oscillospiraceae bacterium]
MKRIISTLLACLLLCGLVMPVAFAEEPPIDVSGAVPLALGVTTTVIAKGVYSYTPNETGWVRFAANESVTLAVFDDELNPLSDGYLTLANSSGLRVKVLARKSLYFAIHYATGQNKTITLSSAEPPVLVQAVKKWTPVSGNEAPFQPFQGGGCVGWTFTVNGEAPSVHGFGYRYYTNIDGIAYGGATAGTYELQFTNYDGEDLGTFTVILEDLTLRGWLEEIFAVIQSNWANEDKTTGEWLKDIGSDIWLIIGAPFVAMAMFTMGPMGWILILPVVLMPFFRLPIDIIGLITSIFR